MAYSFGSSFFYYADIILVFSGAAALLWTLFYYRATIGLRRSAFSGERHQLPLLFVMLFLVSFVVFGFRLIMGRGVFGDVFTYYADTLASIIFFSGAIFVLYSYNVARQTVAALNNELLTVFRNAPVGIHTLNALGQIDFMNPRFLTMTGAGHYSDILGRHVSEVPLYHTSGLDRIIGQAFGEKKKFDTELVWPELATGKKAYFHFVGTPVFGADLKHAERMLILAEDVTSERQLAESIRVRSLELETQRAMLENVVEHMPIGAFLLDAEGQPVFANRAVRRFLNCIDVDLPLTYQVFLQWFASCQIKRLIEGCLSGKPLSVPEVNIGSKIFSLYSICLPAASGAAGKQQYSGHLIWVSDITEQQLLDRARNDFVSIASHEMRTPLTIIRGNASLIREEFQEISKNPELSTMVQSIELGSVRLMKIVNDFLDVVRLEGGTIKFKIEPLDLSQLAAAAIAELETTAQKKGLALHFQPAKISTLVKADRERVLQVLTNLTMNAIQYTDSGGQIEAAVTADAQEAKFLIQDTGSGIDPESQKILFQKFNTASRRFVHSKEFGSGLGLYICKQLVEGMGGHIRLEWSEPGRGSAFSFSLPRVPADAPAPAGRE